jgi:hypothetical protein
MLCGRLPWGEHATVGMALNILRADAGGDLREQLGDTGLGALIASLLEPDRERRVVRARDVEQRARGLVKRTG